MPILISSEYIKTIRRLPLFSGLSDAELTLFAQGITRLSFEKGSLIFAEGDACRELLIVEEGEVKLLKSASTGRQQLLSIERKGSALAEVAVFDGGRYPVTAEAASPSTLLRLSADNFRKICVSNPEMALRVFQVLARRLRRLVGLIEELSFTTVRSRLVAYLIRVAEQTGKPTAQGICFQLTENNEELAARLGTVRELVSRNLGRLHGDGLIQMNKRSVLIRDLSVLREEIDH
jgi:CRP-like cAMP-binding protein